MEWAVATRCRFECDVLLIPDAIGHRLNPSTENDKWTQVGLDATVPQPRDQKYVRSTMRDVNLDDYKIKGR